MVSQWAGWQRPLQQQAAAGHRRIPQSCRQVPRPEAGRGQDWPRGDAGKSATLEACRPGDGLRKAEPLLGMCQSWPVGLIVHVRRDCRVQRCTRADGMVSTLFWGSCDLKITRLLGAIWETSMQAMT